MQKQRKTNWLASAKRRDPDNSFLRKLIDLIQRLIVQNSNNFHSIRKLWALCSDLAGLPDESPSSLPCLELITLLIVCYIRLTGARTVDPTVKTLQCRVRDVETHQNRRKADRFKSLRKPRVQSKKRPFGKSTNLAIQDWVLATELQKKQIDEFKSKAWLEDRTNFVIHTL